MKREGEMQTHTQIIRTNWKKDNPHYFYWWLWVDCCLEAFVHKNAIFIPAEITLGSYPGLLNAHIFPYTAHCKLPSTASSKPPVIPQSWSKTPPCDPGLIRCDYILWSDAKLLRRASWWKQNYLHLWNKDNHNNNPGLLQLLGAGYTMRQRKCKIKKYIKAVIQLNSSMKAALLSNAFKTALPSFPIIPLIICNRFHEMLVAISGCSFCNLKWLEMTFNKSEIRFSNLSSLGECRWQRLTATV